MKILVLNCGSSSVKFQFLEMEGEQVLARGLVEKIGSTGALLRYRRGEAKEIREVAEIPTTRPRSTWCCPRSCTRATA